MAAASFSESARSRASAVYGGHPAASRSASAASANLLVAVLYQCIQQRMLRTLRLNQDRAGLLRPSGAAGDLDDELCQPLIAARVGAEQALVGIDDPDERDFGKMMSFGQHLRADQDTSLAAIDFSEQGLQFAATACRVAIDAHQRLVRKQSV